MTTKATSSVLDLARHISDDPELVKELEARIQRRQVVKKLMAIRAARGLSQQDIAEKMGCTQSRISKLESSDDDNLSLGDFREYLKALDLDLRLIVCPQNWTVSGQITFFADRIKDCLTRLVELAHTDAAICKVVEKLNVTMFRKFVTMFLECAAELPKLPVAAPDVLDAEHEAGDDRFAETCEASRQRSLVTV